MHKRSLLPHIVISLLVALTLQATSTPTLSQNQKYFATGVVTIDTASSYNNASATWNPNVYQVTYPVTFGNNSVGGVFISINSLHVTYQNNRISFYGTYSDVGATSFSLNLYSNITASIQLLSYSYLIFSQSIINRTYFDSSIVIQAVQKYISAANSYSIPVYSNSGLKISNTTNGTLSFIGYDFNLSGSYNFASFYVNLDSVSSSHAIFTVQSNYYTSTYVNTIHFAWIAFDTQYYNKADFASFTLLYQYGSPISYSDNSHLYSQTTMLTVCSVAFQQNYFIDYSIAVNSPDSVTLNSSNTYSSFIVMVLQLFTYYCSY